MRSPYKILLDVVGFLTGSIVNIVLTVIVIVIAFNLTQRAFENGRSFVEVGTGDYREVEIVIPEGADALEIGSILEENGFVQNKYYFWIEVRLNGLYDLMRSGTYKLNTDMSVNEIMDILQRMPDSVASNDEKVMIPEGYNIKQIAELLESKGYFTADEFLAACESRDYNYDFLDPIKDRDNYLEGYLFPDTYFLSENPTPDEIISKMLSRFDDIFDYEFRDRVNELGMTIDDAVIMASIVEREISVADERELASAVIHNRLDEQMPLQMCSTVMYVLDKRKDRLLESDLEIQSPYNTYINTGLPVGPISNPGKASIEAALNPKDVNYLYFVLKDEESGEHFFTSSYDAFLDAKIRYNQKF